MPNFRSTEVRGHRSRRVMRILASTIGQEPMHEITLGL